MGNLKKHPPKWADWLLERFCDETHLEILQGDLHELFEYRVSKHKGFKAKLYYARDVFDMMRPFAFRRKAGRKMNQLDLFRNNLKIGFRNIWRDKANSVINVVGLSMALTAVFTIYLYTNYEKSFDDFFSNTERIYRINTDEFSSGNLVKSSAETYTAFGSVLEADLAEVERTARLYNSGSKNNVVISYEDGVRPINLKQTRFMYAESAFLEMFDYQFVQGKASEALNQPLTAVLSSSMAEKYFGDAPAMGKMLHLKDDDFHDERVIVTGVFEDLAANSHLQFDILFSYKTLLSRPPQASTWFSNSWARPEVYTYVTLTKSSNPQVVEDKLLPVMEKYVSSVENKANSSRFELQWINEIHLNSMRSSEPGATGSAAAIKILEIIGIAILVISWLNFVNLSTARSLKRAREVGVRKSMGAVRSQLIRQFLFESALLNAIAIALSILLLYVLLPVFIQEFSLNRDLFNSINLEFWSYLLMLWFIATFVSGMYPAYVLSTFKPSLVLRGTSKQTGSSGVLRKTLVTFQFALCFCLIGSTLIINDQMNSILKADLGVNIDQVLVVQRPADRGNSRPDYFRQVDLFRSELSQVPSLIVISGSGLIPGKTRNSRVDATPDYDSGRKFSARAGSVDEDFVKLFDLQLLAGPGFQEGIHNDSSVLITESAALQLGFINLEDAIGQGMNLGVTGFSWRVRIAGVVEDFHQESLKKETGPLIMGYTRQGAEYFSFKISSENLPEGTAAIEQAWVKAFPGNPFEYFFLDDYFNQQYRGDLMTKSLLSLFSIIALSLGGLGLMGLSIFVSQQRSKEMGIRKVLGSSTTRLFFLLNMDFLKPIVISSAIAIPAVIFMMNRWLNNFVLNAGIDPLLLLYALLLVFLVGLLTVSYQSIRVSRINPIKSLRNE